MDGASPAANCTAPHRTSLHRPALTMAGKLELTASRRRQTCYKLLTGAAFPAVQPLTLQVCQEPTPGAIVATRSTPRHTTPHLSPRVPPRSHTFSRDAGRYESLWSGSSAAAQSHFPEPLIRNCRWGENKPKMCIFWIRCIHSLSPITPFVSWARRAGVFLRGCRCANILTLSWTLVRTANL